MNREIPTYIYIPHQIPDHIFIKNDHHVEVEDEDGASCTCPSATELEQPQGQSRRRHTIHDMVPSKATTESSAVAMTAGRRRIARMSAVYHSSSGDESTIVDEDIAPGCPPAERQRRWHSTGSIHSKRSLCTNPPSLPKRQGSDLSNHSTGTRKSQKETLPCIPRRRRTPSGMEQSLSPCMALRQYA